LPIGNKGKNIRKRKEDFGRELNLEQANSTHNYEDLGTEKGE